MHFHLPRPLHGWREFVGEVGIIVFGVLIALGAEQLVESFHWKHQVADSRTALDAEMARDNEAFAFRIAARDCIAKRLQKLSDIIERAARHEPLPPVGPVIPDIGNALSSSAWETSRAAQTLDHFPREPLRLYGDFYLQVGSVQEFMLAEVGDWGILKVLQGDPDRLGPTDISGLRVAIQRASFENYIIASIAGEELRTSHQLSIKVPAADQDRLAEVCRPLGGG